MRVAGAQLFGRGHFPCVGTMTNMEDGMVLISHNSVILCLNWKQLKRYLWGACGALTDPKLCKQVSASLE